MKSNFRSNCPITSALDIIGDKWTLVIIKQMLLEGKKTFKDFSQSKEAIASNILSSRLKRMTVLKIIRKEKLPHNKKTNVYRLTERGLGLVPTILELYLWSSDQLREYHPGLNSDNRVEDIINNKEEFIEGLIEDYRAKHSMASIEISKDQ